MSINEEIQKRIMSTKVDIFPLDRILPLSTVYKLVTDEYDRHIDKEDLLRNRKFQRLREGYFSLFVGVFLSKQNSKPYFLVFPEGSDNDVNFLSEKDISAARPEYWKLICDVKEYTAFEHGGFRNFVEKAVLPKIRAKAYHVVIGLHENISGEELSILDNVCSKSSTIWLVSNTNPDGLNFSEGIVNMFQGGGNITQEKINLLLDIPYLETTPIVFQDKLRDKLV